MAAKIIVVEDDPPIREMYLAKLELCGFDVRGACDGVEGLQLAETFLPDVVLLDLLMPNMDGTEMLRQLREQDWSANMHVIILTNISRNEAPSELRFMSVDRYIVKAHYTPSQVADIVKEVLHIR